MTMRKRNPRLEDANMSKQREIQPPVIKNAPMRFAPVNEQGVVLLFADYARKHRIEIEQIRGGFPDCIAYRSTSLGRKRIRIEFEYESRNFALHRHDNRKCDWIVCWRNNWPKKPRNLAIIELRHEYGLGFNVWVVMADPKKFHLDGHAQTSAGRVCSQTLAGDLVLYSWTEQSPSGKTDIREIYVCETPARRTRSQGWSASVRRLAKLAVPLRPKDFVNHTVLGASNLAYADKDDESCASFFTAIPVTDFWNDIRELIISRNPSLKTKLQKYVV